MCLKGFTAWLDSSWGEISDLEDVTQTVVRDFKSYLESKVDARTKRQLAATTVNHYLIALRSFLLFARGKGMLFKSDPLAAIKLKAIANQNETKWLTNEEVDEIYTLCKQHKRFKFQATRRVYNAYSYKEDIYSGTGAIHMLPNGTIQVEVDGMVPNSLEDNSVKLSGVKFELDTLKIIWEYERKNLNEYESPKQRLYMAFRYQIGLQIGLAYNHDVYYIWIEPRD